MFGRELTQQVLEDAKGGDRQVPVIVEKCIDAVEALGMWAFSVAMTSYLHCSSFGL
jgi:hypothetical protein